MTIQLFTFLDYIFYSANNKNFLPIWLNKMRSHTKNRHDNDSTGIGRMIPVPPAPGSMVPLCTTLMRKPGKNCSLAVEIAAHQVHTTSAEFWQDAQKRSASVSVDTDTPLKKNPFPFRAFSIPRQSLNRMNCKLSGSSANAGILSVCSEPEVSLSLRYTHACPV